MIDILHKIFIEGKIPILGICLGMQLLTKKSEEGDADGLGWIPAKTCKFQLSAQFKYKVPHMGWNTIDHIKGSLFKGIINNYVYFVHGYYAELNEMTIAQSAYILSFSAGLQKDNFYAVQFHPEKSGDVGEQILKNFLEL